MKLSQDLDIEDVKSCLMGKCNYCNYVLEILYSEYSGSTGSVAFIWWYNNIWMRVLMSYFRDEWERENGKRKQLQRLTFLLATS